MFQLPQVSMNVNAEDIISASFLLLKLFLYYFTNKVIFITNFIHYSERDILFDMEFELEPYSFIAIIGDCLSGILRPILSAIFFHSVP